MSAHLVCFPDQTVGVGDHILVVGLVAEATVYRPGRPLLYHQGGFGRFVAHPRPRGLVTGRADELDLSHDDQP
ncbi:flavin reductase family protein [Nonomuraea cavernae]|uniref:flavin reductase family protein n=1 Tax=Nonomuraea cavernae TaxID=2045107 RepID=UPI003403435F